MGHGLSKSIKIDLHHGLISVGLFQGDGFETPGVPDPFAKLFCIFFVQNEFQLSTSFHFGWIYTPEVLAVSRPKPAENSVYFNIFGHRINFLAIFQGLVYRFTFNIMIRNASIRSWVILGAALLLPLSVPAFRPSTATAALPVFPPPARPQAATGLDAEQNAARLVDAIIQIESNGNAKMVGSHGERGLMQIKSGTWRDMTVRLFGQPLPFERAFEPDLNRRVGTAYLAFLQETILPRQTEWKSDERSLLLAAYNAGPAKLCSAGFDVTRMPDQTRDYVERASALHDAFVGDLAAVIPGPAGETM